MCYFSGIDDWIFFSESLQATHTAKCLVSSPVCLFFRDVAFLSNPNAPSLLYVSVKVALES